LAVPIWLTLGGSSRALWPPTCYNRFVRWRKAGVWDRLLAAVSAGFNGELVMIDSTCARAHQHGTTAKKGIIRSRHGRALSPGAPLPANSMLLSTLRDVLSACEAEALIADIPNCANLLGDLAMTAAPSVRPLLGETYGPTFPTGPTASSASAFRHGFTASATLSNASSIGSSSSAGSLPVTTRTPPISSPPSNSSAPASGAPRQKSTS